MVNVKLTEDSKVGRWRVRGTGGEECVITRNDSATVPLLFALSAGKSPDLIFTFEESARKELLTIEGHTLKMALREYEVESLEELEIKVLGKKVTKRATKAKTSTKPKSSTTKAKPTTKSKKND